MVTEQAEVRLTPKQRMFVDAYVGVARGNATKAAQLAGYKDPEQAGYENKKKQEIAELIASLFTARTLSREQVLDRLTEHANGTIEHFIRSREPDSPVDLTSDAAQANLHLIKKLKTKRRSGGTVDNPWQEIEQEIELHDPQQALVQIGRFHKLFTDHTVLSGDSEEPIVVKVLSGATTMEAI